MIKVYNKTKVYVHSPAGLVTGGVELLHQLVHILQGENIDAYIVYFGEQKHEIPAEYNCYNINTIEHKQIEDSERNIEIVCETIPHYLKKHKHTQKLLWWLSIDCFYRSATQHIALRDLAKWSPHIALKAFIKRTRMLFSKTMGEGNSFFNTLSLKRLREMNVMHGYQSEYAQNFLQNRGFGELIALKDFINTDHIAEFSCSGREDIVLYNPKKGMKFTQKLIDTAPDIKWVAVENMTRVQLVKLMRKSKLYLDFGHHPGKDRLPRECVMNGCCIITGKRGSAAYFEDVPIPNKYKFREREAPKQTIIESIRYTLSNYETAVDDFTYYRASILREKSEFETQVKNLFAKSKSNSTPDID